jgi:integrase/recombinase XerD
MITIRIDHREPTLLAVSFPEDPIGNDLIRSVPGYRFSYSRRCWLVPNTRHAVVQLGQLFGREYCRFDEAVVRLYKPHATPAQREQATNPAWPPMSKQLAEPTFRTPFRFAPTRREYDRHPVIMAVSDALRVQNYSYKTFKNYKQALIALINYTDPKPLDQYTKVQYQQYLLFLIEKKRLSPATINVHINAWKFYCEKVLQREKAFYDIPYPRQATKLPTVYSATEIKDIFQATTSLKYRTVFKMVYSTGLRLSEVAHLRLTDLDRVRRLITVRGGKGKKDRIVMLTPTLEAVLDEYLLHYQRGSGRLQLYLFENTDTIDPINIRTLQRVYSQSVRRAGIRKEGGIHSLRHTFATHLLESGLDIRYIQELLGHDSILTTMRYTHVTAHKIGTFRSPLDDL